jgi:hypothetical protein
MSKKSNHFWFSQIGDGKSTGFVQPTDLPRLAMIKNTIVTVGQ